ncbi:hypothetical protein FACS189418_3950 [Clostridia bacterium]|nr:hypothetical protein FACS189418_3950 [Clostridia bacterium]
MKKTVYAICLLCMVFTLSCTKKEVEKKAYTIYYQDLTSPTLVPYTYYTDTTAVLDLINELYQCLEEVPAELKVHSVVPKGVRKQFHQLKQGYLSIHFNQNYPKVGTIEEILFRAAVVKTLSCISEEVEKLEFWIEDQILLDTDNNPVGLMSSSTFLNYYVDAHNQPDSSKKSSTVSLILYFANAEGNKLVEKIQEVENPKALPLERLVVEQLIQGPTEENLYPTISNHTKILNFSVNDEICYIDLDSNFLTPMQKVKPEVAIYSLVNSLTEISNITKVSISVEGEQNRYFYNQISLKDIFERNIDEME